MWVVDGVGLAARVAVGEGAWSEGAARRELRRRWPVGAEGGEGSEAVVLARKGQGKEGDGACWEGGGAVAREGWASQEMERVERRWRLVGG